MAMAREGEIQAILVLFPMLLLLHSNTTQADTFIVGDDLGWTANASVGTWPQGKTFFASDILVFNYDNQLYNVVVTDQVGYNSCTITTNSQVFESGHDRIHLVFGENYFMTGNPNDCQLGMTMAVTAEN
ncbi:basic blue protein-like [Hevea brasiliensis]|uniref:basic blue protein-like n=1 Tax=Hevea brasiliensis TaxID=3981 RepID=UPI0025EA9FC1|nr:basic blue protein-like [Hevea brasiliensis]